MEGGLMEGKLMSMGGMRELAVRVVRPLIADGAELGARLYRVVDDKFGEPPTFNTLVYIFNEYPEEVVRDAIERLVLIGAIIDEDGYFMPAPDASG
jgi:hypothetical protein